MHLSRTTFPHSPFDPSGRNGVVDRFPFVSVSAAFLFPSREEKKGILSFVLWERDNLGRFSLSLSLASSRPSSSNQPPDRPSAKGKERRPLGVFYIVHRGNRRREDGARVDGFASTKRRMLIQRLNIHLASSRPLHAPR